MLLLAAPMHGIQFRTAFKYIHGIQIPHAIRKVTGVFRYSGDRDTQVFQF